MGKACCINGLPQCTREHNAPCLDDAADSASDSTEEMVLETHNNRGAAIGCRVMTAALLIMPIVKILKEVMYSEEHPLECIILVVHLEKVGMEVLGGFLMCSAKGCGHT